MKYGQVMYIIYAHNIRLYLFIKYILYIYLINCKFMSQSHLFWLNKLLQLSEEIEREINSILYFYINNWINIINVKYEC